MSRESFMDLEGLATKIITKIGDFINYLSWKFEELKDVFFDR